MRLHAIMEDFIYKSLLIVKTLLEQIIKKFSIELSKYRNNHQHHYEKETLMPQWDEKNTFQKHSFLFCLLILRWFAFSSLTFSKYLQLILLIKVICKFEIFVLLPPFRPFLTTQILSSPLKRCSLHERCEDVVTLKILLE